MIATETDLKREVLKIAYANGWKVYHETHSPKRGSQGTGYPDLTLARMGQVLFMELKTAEGRLSREQSMWLAELPASHVIRPVDLEVGVVARLLA